MVRNLDRRVEVVFPVENRKLIGRLRNEILGTYLADTHNAHLMQADGSYVKLASSTQDINSQANFLKN
jgi:polyphosphate kinase